MGGSRRKAPAVKRGQGRGGTRASIASAIRSLVSNSALTRRWICAEPAAPDLAPAAPQSAEPQSARSPPARRGSAPASPPEPGSPARRAPSSPRRAPPRPARCCAPSHRARAPREHAKTQPAPRGSPACSLARGAPALLVSRLLEGDGHEAQREEQQHGGLVHRAARQPQRGHRPAQRGCGGFRRRRREAQE